MDLKTLISRLLSSGDVDAIVSNTRAQFGTATRRYLGATFLPERLVPELSYEEREIRFRTVIANDGTRYSPAQLKDSGALVGTFNVLLGHSDIARQFTSRDYDGMLRMLGRGRDMDAMVRILGWFDTALNLALIELDEKHRWDCLLNAMVVRRGDNGYTEPIYYPNPPGHRVIALNQWSDPTYDPWNDITGMAQFLYDKGYAINRIVTSRKVISILANNPKMAQRALAVPMVLGPSNTLQPVLPGMRLSVDQINNALAREDLPPIERYDLSYNTQVGQARFFRQDAFFMAATTGRTEEIMVEQDDDPLLIPNVLGYTAIGPAAGQTNSGRAYDLESFTNKPPRIQAEAWEASLPVLQDPEAVGVITGIS
jgi:hypothetical protein